jgi:hypothetical protein
VKFFAFWQRASAEGVDARGRPVRFACWRWSDASPEDALQSAQAAARRIVARLIAGEPLDRYAYGVRPLREEVKQTFDSIDGQPLAAITQNGYGALVLNTARVMFIDLDFRAIAPGEHLRYLFSKWFDRGAIPPAERIERERRAVVAQFVDGNQPWHARIYRTHSGLRVLAAHDLFDPEGEATQAVFRTLSADPLYAQLCRQQQCFRARLTPKPWRCGHRANAVAWPRESPLAQQQFDAWQAEYVERQSGYATCRFLESRGDGAIHPQAQQIIEIHDKLTRCHEPLELA